MKTLSFASSVLIGVTLVTRALALDVDPQLPAYKPAQLGSAEIKSVGSDTMGDLMRNWSAQFTKLNPAVKIEVESKGSSTAPPALIDGASQLGAMSRSMRSEEYEPFEKKCGYHPSSFPVALDALAVYVNKDNPIECLTIEQLDQIFSKSHLYSGGKNVITWGEAGLTGEWAAHPISLFGRNSASGTYRSESCFSLKVIAPALFTFSIRQVDIVAVTASQRACAVSGLVMPTRFRIRRIQSNWSASRATLSGSNCTTANPLLSSQHKAPLRPPLIALL